MSDANLATPSREVRIIETVSGWLMLVVLIAVFVFGLIFAIPASERIAQGV